MTQHLCFLRQSRHISCSNYLDRFNIMIEHLEGRGGTFGYSEGMVRVELPTCITLLIASVEQINNATSNTCDKYFAAAFLTGSVTTRYGKLLKELENDYLRGDTYCYPTDLNKTYGLILNWKSDPQDVPLLFDNKPYEGVSCRSSDDTSNVES